MGPMSRVTVTHFTDPGCPWAYSAGPALAVLRWRYSDQLDWRLVTIGLTERVGAVRPARLHPRRRPRLQQRFRRYGMPFAPQPKPRVGATARTCRAIHAARLQAPEREHAVFRALQFAQFTPRRCSTTTGTSPRCSRGSPGVDAGAIVAALDDPDG